jgi:ribonuclease D
VELLQGLPEVVTTSEGLRQAIDALSQGDGPVAVDAERASGFKYGQRAYLVQFYRRGGGTWLVDPTAFDDLVSLSDALNDAPWILHAASQDLPCMREVGLVPQRIFDTELAARLLGRERVGLGPLVESELGLHLAKGHGAADWSRRPLPDDWLRYAALDVEVLVDLHDVLVADLTTVARRRGPKRNSSLSSTSRHHPPGAIRGGAPRACTVSAVAGRSPWCELCGNREMNSRSGWT